ncbi:MAG: signal peptidase II [Nitrospirae bacterium]|nr:signal peptidase II [Nitrospirota bacterium]
MKKDPSIFFIFSMIIVVLDQLTKHFIQTNFRYEDNVTMQVTSFFNIVHVHNIGSAFGMFKGLGNTVFIIIALAAILLITVLIVRDRRNRLPLALILGGAVGNITDRISLGHVVDFLDFHAGSHHWPSFNVADSALTVGISLLLVMTLTEKKTDSSS